VRFYWRTELSVFLGTAIAAAALVGGLLVGDCVTYSLRRLALMRLGETHQAMQLRGRFFDADLATRLEAAAYVPVTPVLVLRGVVLAAQPDGDTVQVNHVQVVGVDSRFWRLAPGASYALDRDTVAVNQKLAAQLGIAEGAEISVRVGKPSLMPHDAPLASRKDALTRRGTFTVGHVVSDDHLGRFSLAANQVAPHNVFVDIGWLQDAIDLPGRANTMLVGALSASAGEVSAAVKQVWRPEDMGLTLRRRGATLQLESDRIFIEPAVSSAGLFAGLETGSDAVGVLTYLVNSVRKGDRSTPYSFAVAAEASRDASLSLVPPGMRDDEVIINQWLADQLEAGAGDTITVSYFALHPSGGFVERERGFTVRRVASMDEVENERVLMPMFPGLTDVDQCREWDVGMPMEEAALQDEANQAYWDAYGATPKLIVALAAGQEMWANRFGDLSAIRYRVRERDEPALRESLRRAIDPAALGLFLKPVREQALKAVSEALSLGEWFAYMSFFLIAAALMLTGMLFVFGIQQRSEEIGILLGVGHRPGHVRRLFLWEGGIVALGACMVGGLLGTGYTRFLVWGLARYWQGAVANAAIVYHAETSTVAMGVGSSFVCALVAMGIAMWHQTRRSARELLAGDIAEGRSMKAGRRARLRTLAFSVFALFAAYGTVVLARVGDDADTVTLFFGAGFLLLLSGLGFSRLLLQRLEPGEGQSLTVSNMGLRNAARRPGRSLTAVALLAFGCFIVFAVSAMQQDLAASAGERWSGTGGFALFGETTLPVPDALEAEEGRARFGLDREDALAGVEIVSVKVRDGDDASCFNLNRAQTPRLLGVDAGAFRSRGAFMAKRDRDGSPWSLLDVELPDGVIPGLAGDTTTVMWNLQKRVGPDVGDEIVYRNEQGETFRVRLVGTLPMPLSVLQGTVLISKADFMARYPSESGYRLFLADLPDGADAAAVQQALTRRLDRVGLDMTPSLDRLLAFHGVEATYLTMFLVLGGLGVVLGTFGLGIVVLRNMLERRSELAILRCVGFSRARVLWLVLAEHWMLLLLGLGCGLVSAMVAIYPSLSTPGMHVPLGGIAALLGGIVLAGLGSTGIAVFVALRGDLIPALRKE
jgi:putative ABC transport system permease protein